MQGLTGQETAKEMHLSFETIKDYKKRITRKTEARNIVHAIVMLLKDS